MRISILFLALFSKALYINAFTVTQSSPSNILRSKTIRSSTTDRESYGEISRQTRRTTYSHDDWVKHRSPDRFLYNLGTIGSSDVYKGLAKVLTTTTSISFFVFVWNMICGGYTDLSGVQHDALIQGLPLLGMPMAPLTLASGSLGLLLVFRTNSSYRRWDEARKNWGMNINHTRDLVRLANAYYDPNYLYNEADRNDPSRRMTPQQEALRRQEDLNRVALATWSFVRAMKRHLSPEWEDEAAFRKEIREKLSPAAAQAIIDAAHRPNRALFDISVAIEKLPMYFMRKNEIHAAVTIFEDNLGSSERLLTSPVPLVYSRHTARFVSLWLLFVPFALYDPMGTTWNHIGMLPATAVLSVFFFGIDELATQIEEPFTILPMQAFCDKIYNWCTENVSWKPNDTGIFNKEEKIEVY